MKGFIIALAVILILGLGGAAAYYFLLMPKSGIELDGLSSQWQKIDETPLKDGASGVAFRGTSTLQEGLADFKNSLEQAGWKHIKDDIQAELYTATFEKGNQQAYVQVFGREGDVKVYVLVYETPKLETKTASFAAQDIAGEDIPNIPRYPGSVRTKYETAPREVLVEYLVHSDVSAVTAFYTGYLPAQGWMFQAVSTGSGNVEMTATKTGQGILTLNVSAEPALAGSTVISLLLVSMSY